MKLRTQRHGPITKTEERAYQKVLEHLKITEEDAPTHLMEALHDGSADETDMKRIMLMLYETWVE